MVERIRYLPYIYGGGTHSEVLIEVLTESLTEREKTWGEKNSREMTPGICRARCCCVAVAMSSSSAAVVTHYTSRAFGRECAELAPPYAFRGFGNFSISLLIPFLSDSILFCACSLSVPPPRLRRIVSRLCGVVFLPNSADISCVGQASLTFAAVFFPLVCG